jgi:glycosyltransferase involved in cell wall biosynthesis
MDGARDFRMMNRSYVNALLQLSEYNRFSKGMFGWVGFDTKWIDFENVERVAGKTKWSFWKLFLYSIEGIVDFSAAPLAIASYAGVCMCGLSMLTIIFIIIRQLLFGGSAFGWPSLACIVIFIGGIQLLCTGILGSYLSRTYLEVKNRPIYICKETNVNRVEENNVENK